MFHLKQFKLGYQFQPPCYLCRGYCKEGYMLYNSLYIMVYIEMYSTVYNVIYSKVYSIVLDMVHECIPTNKIWQGRGIPLKTFQL